MALATDVWGFRGCRLQEGMQTEFAKTRHHILDSSENIIGWIGYDLEDHQGLPLELAVVVAMDLDDNFLLL